ncbi:hypothetical protein MASR1M32_29320 [Rhodobacter sp.]
MADPRQKITTVDPLWRRLCDEAEEAVRAEPLLGALIHSGLLHHPRLSVRWPIASR